MPKIWKCKVCDKENYTEACIYCETEEPTKEQVEEVAKEMVRETCQIFDSADLRKKNSGGKKEKRDNN